MPEGAAVKKVLDLIAFSWYTNQVSAGVLELADETDSKSVAGNSVWVRPPPPAPRLNGLCSIQKAQPVGWAFLIPFCHSSFSPTYGPRRRADINFITQTHIEMDYAPSKKPSCLAGLFLYYCGISFFPSLWYTNFGSRPPTSACKGGGMHRMPLPAAFAPACGRFCSSFS